MNVPAVEVRVCPVCDASFTVDRQHRRQLYCGRAHQIKAYRDRERRRLTEEGRHVPPSGLTHTILIRLPLDLADSVRAMARVRGMSMSAIIREAITEHGAQRGV